MTNVYGALTCVDPKLLMYETLRTLPKCNKIIHMKAKQKTKWRLDRARLVFASILIILSLCANLGIARETGDHNLPPLSYRTWTSEAGQTLEAAFIHLHQNQVVLKDREEQRIAIPINRLSWRDQIMARRLSGLRGTEPLSSGRRAVTQRRRAADAKVIAAFGSDCEPLLIDAIQDARREILVAIYTMTSLPIAEALREAAQRGVDIHIKYDKGQIEVGRMSEIIESLEPERNITITPIEMSGRFASMHHKFAVMDQAVVFTGSFNFTVTAATQSYENAVVIYSDSIAQRYTQEFESIESR